MISVFVSFGALFLSLAILSVGNGLLPTLVAVRAGLEGFSALDLGIMASAYFALFGVGCLVAVRIVRRVGHIRTFAVLASVVGATASLHALVVDPHVWMALRGIAGFCFAGLYVVIESWVNELSTNANRGRVLSIYRIVDLAAVTGGQFLLPLADPAGFPLFSIVTVLIALSLVPVGLTTGMQPGPVEVSRVRLWHFYRASPLGMVGCAAVGLTLGAFWGLGARVAADVGLDSTAIATFMASAVVGGAVLQLPVGRISDRLDRRTVLAATAGAAVLAGLGLAAVLWLELGAPAVFVAVGFFGGAGMPLYSLCVAHLNDNLGPMEFVEAGAALLTAYAIGAAIGPIGGAMLLARFGPASVFLFTAGVHLALVLFALYRMTRRAPVPAAEQAPFVAMPQDATPQVFALDPRGPELDQSDPVEPRDDAEPEPKPAGADIPDAASLPAAPASSDGGSDSDASSPGADADPPAPDVPPR